MAASWFRVVSKPKGLVRLLLIAPDSLPLVQAIRQLPLHVGLSIVRPDNIADALRDGEFDVVLSDQIGVLMQAQEKMPTTRRVWVVSDVPFPRSAWACPHHILQWNSNLSDLTAVLDSCLDGDGVPDLVLPKDENGDLP
jgi:hypothetical protein